MLVGGFMPIQQTRRNIMKQHLTTMSLFGLLTMATVAFLASPVQASDIVPQTAQEKANHVERVKLPCIGICDPKHYMYILRETD
jgi:hypothetical protein